MPSLADLTDYDPMGNVQSVMPEADGVRRVYIGDAVPEGTASGKPSLVDRITNKLLGLNGEERYQLWPEKVVREGLSAAGDVLANGALPPGLRREDFTDIPAPDAPTKDSTALGRLLNMAPVAASPADDIIEKSQAMSALAGSGGLAGTTDATLGATPFLRPALKYKDRLYKGKDGQAHHDVIPDALYPEFQKMAMSGDDISHYNFGFHNDKGQFLTREAALEYGINTGIIDPTAGKYGALTSTLLADSSKPGMAIEATAKANQPTFFSALEHNVGKIAQDKMTGDQWLGTLANKPGVKPEELQWSGLKDYLEQNKGKPVTKADIEAHLAQNKTELGEVIRGSGKLKAAEKELETAIGSGMPFGKGKLYSDEVIRGLVNEDLSVGDLPLEFQGLAKNLLKEHKENIPEKYKQYQVPGGENYREVLMTLPEGYSKPSKDAMESVANLAFNKKYNELTKAQQENVERMAMVKTEPTYKSGHWDEPNILAHMRMNDRIIDGKKSLHLEEVQSDWHQAGRKEGYRPDNEKKFEGLVKQRDELQNEVKTLSPSDPRYKEIHSELPKVQSQIREMGVNNPGVPDAPFKKNWHELALKRAIREAAENGYDRLSWTAGEHHPTNPKNLRQSGPDAEAADKGMQGFYNNMLPKSVEKLTGQKVKEGPLEKPSYNAKADKWYLKNDPKNQIFNTEAEAAKAAIKIYYIDIPQSVKDTALGKGFPLYSSSHMFTPVAGNPFENDK